MSLPNLSGSNIQDTYQRVLHTSGGAIFDGTGSTIPISFNGDDVTVAGTLTAQTYVVSESVVNVSSGSTMFGNSSDDTHRFTGDITASNNISASGNIESDTIQIGDSSITTPSYNLHIRDTDSVNAVLEATGNGNATLELKNNQTPDWHIRNRFSQGGLHFTANHHVLHLDDDGTTTISGSLVLTGTGVSGNITASGNISSSGNLTISQSLTFGGDDVRIDFGEKLTIGSGTENDYIKIVDEQIKFYVGGGEALVINDSSNKILIGYGGGITETTIGKSNITAVKHVFTTVGEPNHQQFGQTRMGKYGDLNFGSTATLHLTGSGHADYTGTALEVEGNIISSGSLDIIGNVTASGDISASGNLYADITADTDNSVVIYKNGRLYTDEIDSRVWGSTLIDNTDSAACADQIKTIQCAVTDAPRYLTFVDDNNASSTCETLRTNENIFWNCRTRTLTVNGAIKSKGSDITMMSGSISASGAITASNVSMSGDMIATTGSFNHIVTDGDTIEFRQAGTTTKLGHIKFSDKGAEFGDSAGTGKSNLTASIVLATSKFVSEGSAEFTGDVTMSGHFSASGELDTSKVRTGKMLSISSDGSDLQFGNSTNGTRIHGDFIQLGNPALTNQHVTASGNISSSGDVLASRYLSDGQVVVNTATADIVTFGNGNMTETAIKAGSSGKISLSSPVFALSHITASGNISASGDLFGDDITAATKFVGTELESSTNITLDATDDIILSADGDQIKMNDGTTTRFTFNVDSTPEIDVTGDLIIDPTGGDVKVDGIIQSYANSSYPNYAIGGSQGYAVNYMIPAGKFVPENVKFANTDFTANSMKFTGTTACGHSFIIPQGYQLTRYVILMNVAKSNTEIYSTSGSGWCAPTKMATVSSIKCPTVNPGQALATYNLATAPFHPSIISTLVGEDATVCTIRINTANKDQLFGAFLTMAQMS